MRAIDAMIVWTPTTPAQVGSDPSPFDRTAGQVAVVEWPDPESVKTGDYQKSVGACFLEFRTSTDAERLTELLLYFHTIVIRDGLDVAKTHAAFLDIDEYAEAISPGIVGAREKIPDLASLSDDIDIDLKALPLVTEAITKILDAAKLMGPSQERGLVELLRQALKTETDRRPPVHRKVQALWLAMQSEGAYADQPDLERRAAEILHVLAPSEEAT